MVVKITPKRALVAAAVLGALGLAVAWSGVINVGASTGHWAVTDWFLHWAMRNSTRTHAALTVIEPATDPTGLVSAAGHFAASCAVCHGAPGEPPSPVMQAATPAAPDLAATAPTWSDAELFWIVKHGVKFTAMPAWPALERDDEIRRMAAFVRRLPSLPIEEYRDLAYGDGRIVSGAAAPPEEVLADCERCHAANGRGQPEIPVLAGQKPEYLERALREYAAGTRASGVMQAASARVAAPTLAALAAHYAAEPGGLRALPAVERSAQSEAADVIARGIPELDLPACASCHAEGKRAEYPRLAGQKAAYIAGRLRRWRGEEDVADARKPYLTMPVIARRIPEHLIEPLARHLEAP